MAWELLGGGWDPSGWASQWLPQVSLGSNAKCSPSGISLPDLTGIKVLSIEAYEERNYTYVPGIFGAGLPGSKPIPDLNFCNVTVTYTHPGWHDTINVNTLLPTNDWNGRFTGVGGGNLATGGGEVAGFLMMPIMASGHATATTDGGHSSDVLGPEANDPSWALTSPGNVNWPLLMDFASVALHDTATIGKAVTKAFYGTSPKHSYFFGGSTGGRQGHMLAQRYPQDYDGIIALFPATNWVKFFWASYWPKFVMDKMGVYPKPCEFEAITAAVMSACDKLDGVEDGIISRLDLCNFDPHKVVGKIVDCDGTEVAVSSAAADITQATWDGPRSSMGEFQWYGYGKGTDLTQAITGPIQVKCNEDSCKAEGNPVWVRYWVKKEPSFDISKIAHQEWDDLVHLSINEFDSIIGTSDPDLSEFKRRGGKMINWHGTVDAAIPFNGSTDYYDRVLAKDPEAHDYYRLFVAPGAGHCFNCGPSPPLSMDPIIHWVEDGVAPDTLRASGANGLGVHVERDICMYPGIQHYLGGDPNVASSFTCV
ncbi:putative feruloyl esterase [Colletotrichum fructicola]|uniref:Carboxylic ester hydrolase n=1 Tax=Colletotrichum fructicola (strain Nara gc5) TaxID=1213859 RepID=L2G7L3_COLFN|nr:putative feruloyl esterase [Colletotrichum fructicola]KAF4475535.1 putative feruloyl esterase [Colletotrichum fructicola Nara gc5]KAE9573104.1 putative feruloyl esterase [Colletotrichum fructicola]KAF4420713.1 putative feruloyl esterase [Colletotrichum fructicola]KAF4882122.1 putative feruloyl esterase [Colletotrichum fructicola]KAF4899273.1 putative feruloyl esterase [Colletotrichum fructicola]